MWGGWRRLTTVVFWLLPLTFESCLRSSATSPCIDQPTSPIPTNQSINQSQSVNNGHTKQCIWVHTHYGTLQSSADTAKRLIKPLFVIQCESKKTPPAVFWHFFPNRWEFFNQFLHTYYTFLSTLDYKFLFNYLQLRRSYAILSATTQRIFTFHLEVKLLSLLTEQMTSLLTSRHIQHVCWHYKSVYFIVPQTTINKAINDLRKRLNARVLARFGHFAHMPIMWTR